MKYNNLTIEQHKTTKRLGRGIASGKGKTAGRGTKGQGARTGARKRPGFEGGQTPIMQHLPKLPGFRSMHAKAQLVYTDQLDQFAGKTVDTQVLAAAGLIADQHSAVKLLAGKGSVTKKVTVKLQAASTGAIAQVEQAGGSFEFTPRLARVSKRPAEEKK